MAEIGIYRFYHKEGGEIGWNTELVAVCYFEFVGSRRWFCSVAKVCSHHDFFNEQLFGDKQYLIGEVSPEDLNSFDCGATFYYGRKPIIKGMDMLKCSGTIPGGFFRFLRFCDFVQDYEEDYPLVDDDVAVAICYEEWKAKKAVKRSGCVA